MKPRMWKAPRLTVEGKPFEPELGEVGSWVSFVRDGVTYHGQVWSKAPRPKTVWVVTDAGHAECLDVAYLTHRHITPTREATQ